VKVLVVGGGGREHALIWKLKQSKQVEKVYCVPGNAGIAALAECVDIDPGNHDALLDLVKYEWIDLTMIGPEAPLAGGIVDAFEKAGRRIVGPNKYTAQLEASKSFAKDFMRRYGIPTAEYKTFTSYTQAEDYVRLKGAPVVVKADGLAAGKGVVICKTVQDASDALRMIMKERAFGNAGDRVVVEECLVGEEASFMAFCDGTTILPMVSSQDHKRVNEGDEGPNTGGMGAYSPAPVVEGMDDEIMRRVMWPVLDGFRREGYKFKGILYAGLMLTDKGPKVLEYNCRFGDPETQPILMRMESDLAEVLVALADEKLSGVKLRWRQEAATCVVLASEGYPGSYPRGRVITGIDEANAMEGVHVFHAGTAFGPDGSVVTNGGRVLGVTALGDGLKAARERAHEAIAKIHFDGMHYRRDIGDKALRRHAQS
jgi:phosphoribosylamine--glycine ligase